MIQSAAMQRSRDQRPRYCGLEVDEVFMALFQGGGIIAGQSPSVDDWADLLFCFVDPTLGPDSF